MLTLDPSDPYIMTELGEYDTTDKPAGAPAAKTSPEYEHELWEPAECGTGDHDGEAGRNAGPDSRTVMA
jgi:hypothetical protein